MKLNRIDNREPQQVRVTLPAATVEKLEAYLEYANSNGQGFTDLKQLITEICRAFVANGDKDFTQWLRSKISPATFPAHPTLPAKLPAKENQSRKANGEGMQEKDTTLLRD
jgi:hypothetical protein